MKKYFTLMLTVFLLLSSVSAQIQNLAVRKDRTSSAPPVSYEYKGNFGSNYYWIGKESGQDFVIFNSGGTWVLRAWYGDFFGGNNIDISKSTEKYPLTGWSTIQVQLEGPRLFYNTTSLNEASTNLGEFTDTIFIRHNKVNDKKLAGSAGDNLIANNHVEIDQLPNGLTAHAILVSDSTAKLFFSGNAKEHNVDSSIEIRFKNAAFANGGTADSTIGATMPIKVNFINSWIVGNEPNDIKLIQSAMDSAKNYDVVFIRKGTYTQTGILRKDQSKLMEYVYLIGEGPEATIIQGSNIPFDSTGRIFNLAAIKKAHFKNLTIQNASAKGLQENGGAVSSPFAVIIENCRFTKNRTYSTSNYGSGGAVQAKTVHIKNSEFSDNHAQSSNTGFAVSGGAVSAQGVTIENSTFSGNSCIAQGGAVMIGSNHPSLIINSTFVNNSSKNDGGAIYTYNSVKIYNSILSNNKAKNGGDLFSLNNHVFKVNATGSFIKDTASKFPKISMFSVNPSFEDPKIDTILRFNCGLLQTHTLLSNSPAINNSIDDTIFISVYDQRGYKANGKRDIGAHETNASVEFYLDEDTVCIEDKKSFKLSATPHIGEFSGEFISNNKLDLTNVTKEGYVYVSYTFDLSNCENTTIKDSIYVKMCVQNSVKKHNHLISVFPNPAQSELIFSNSNNSPMTVSIFSISGAFISKHENIDSNNQIIIKNLKTGLYFAIVESDDSKSTVKFIKE